MARLLIILVLSFLFDSALAAELQSRSLEPVGRNSEADQSSFPLSSIWSDKLKTQTGADVSPSAPRFLNATFKDGDYTILVSVYLPDCRGLSGALSRVTNASDCPLRIAIVKSEGTKVIEQNEHFVLGLPADKSGAVMKSNKANSTTFVYDAVTRDLKINQKIDGLAADVNTQSIHLNF